MESIPDVDLDPNKDDLPLRANTNHMLVRHYVLDLTVYFQRKVIGGSIVLFLEPGIGSCKQAEPGSGSNTEVQNTSQVSCKHDTSSPITPEPNEVIPPEEPSRLGGGNYVSNVFWGDESEEFTLVLDCCDLMVSKVEEVDVKTVPNLNKLDVVQQYANADRRSSSLVQRLVSMPSVCCGSQHELYLQCSRSPTVPNAQPLRFHTDRWSLQIRKEGVCSPHDFPSAVRIWYETKPTGGSVRWTKDQDGRYQPCLDIYMHPQLGVGITGCLAIRYMVHDTDNIMIHQFCDNQYIARPSYNDTSRDLSNYENKMPGKGVGFPDFGLKRGWAIYYFSHTAICLSSC